MNERISKIKAFSYSNYAAFYGKNVRRQASKQVPLGKLDNREDASSSHKMLKHCLSFASDLGGDDDKLPSAVAAAAKKDEYFTTSRNHHQNKILIIVKDAGQPLDRKAALYCRRRLCRHRRAVESKVDAF